MSNQNRNPSLYPWLEHLLPPRLVRNVIWSDTITDELLGKMLREVFGDGNFTVEVYLSLSLPFLSLSL